MGFLLAKVYNTPPDVPFCRGNTEVNIVQRIRFAGNVTVMSAGSFGREYVTVSSVG